eukprot:gene12220-15351_t
MTHDTQLMTEIKSMFQEFKTELKTEIAELKTELKTEIAELKTELKADMNPSFDPGSSFFTLKEATVLFRSCNFYDNNPRTFKGNPSDPAGCRVPRAEEDQGRQLHQAVHGVSTQPQAMPASPKPIIRLPLSAKTMSMQDTMYNCKYVSGLQALVDHPQQTNLLKRVPSAENKADGQHPPRFVRRCESDARPQQGKLPYLEAMLNFRGRG